MPDSLQERSEDVSYGDAENWDWDEEENESASPPRQSLLPMWLIPKTRGGVLLSFILTMPLMEMAGDGRIPGIPEDAISHGWTDM